MKGLRDEGEEKEGYEGRRGGGKKGRWEEG